MGSRIRNICDSICTTDAIKRLFVIGARTGVVYLISWLMLDIFEVSFDPGEDGAFFGMCAVAFLSPHASRMNLIPIGLCLLVSAATGIVVAEAIYGSIPERHV